MLATVGDELGVVTVVCEGVLVGCEAVLDFDPQAASRNTAMKKIAATTRTRRVGM
jgi:hypothetical protein